MGPHIRGPRALEWLSRYFLSPSPELRTGQVDSAIRVGAPSPQQLLCVSWWQEAAFSKFSRFPSSAWDWQRPAVSSKQGAPISYWTYVDLSPHFSLWGTLQSFTPHVDSRKCPQEASELVPVESSQSLGSRRVSWQVNHSSCMVWYFFHGIEWATRIVLMLICGESIVYLDKTHKVCFGSSRTS